MSFLHMPKRVMNTQTKTFISAFKSCTHRMNLGIKLWYQFKFFFFFKICFVHCYGGTYKRLYFVSFKVEGFSLHSFLLHSLKYLCLVGFCKSKTAFSISSWYDMMRITFWVRLIENEEKIHNLVCAMKDWEKKKKKRYYAYDFLI